MSANPNIAALLYLVAGSLFILALKGLSSPASSRAGNRNGMIGMAIAVGTALDIASPTATGDFSTVLSALTGLDTQQGPAALNTISGQPYTGFGTMNAQARSPSRGSGMPTIATACTAGWRNIRPSISTTGMFSPPRMIMSLARPVMRT